MDQLLGRSTVTYHLGAKRKNHTMPKVKPVTAMKQRLQESLSDLAEQEEVIELVRQAIEAGAALEDFRNPAYGG